MSELKLLEEQKKVAIELSGAATIGNASEILNLFIEAYKQNKNIEINHQKVEAFDVTYLQLLNTLNKAITGSGFTLRLVGTNPESFIALVKGSGIPFNQLSNDEQDNGFLGGNVNE